MCKDRAHKSTPESAEPEQKCEACAELSATLRGASRGRLASLPLEFFLGTTTVDDLINPELPVIRNVP